jgi:hypothetical protein
MRVIAVANRKHLCFLCPALVPFFAPLGFQTSFRGLEKRGNMQEIVVQSTKYPEIVVQGSRYDYTSDIVLVVVGVLAAAAIIWRYTASRRGKD